MEKTKRVLLAAEVGKAAGSVVCGATTGALVGLVLAGVGLALAGLAIVAPLAAIGAGAGGAAFGLFRLGQITGRRR